VFIYQIFTPKRAEFARSFQERAMKLFILLLFIGIACVWPTFAGAGKIYTWTDAKGVTHITETPPPSGKKIDTVIDYTPKPADEDRQAEEKHRQFLEESGKQAEMDLAARRAKTTRRNAEAARAKADQAQAEADAAFQRSEEFKMKVSNTINRWQRNKSTRKKLEAEAAAAQQKAQKAVQEADKLEKLAQEADNAAAGLVDREKNAAAEKTRKPSVEFKQQ
jgi:hypothetical protein